jgi:acetyl esterase
VKDVASSASRSRGEQLRARAELAIARRLFNLPSVLSRRLSGGPALELDGQRLHPDMQLLLTTMRWRTGKASLHAATVALARSNMREGTIRYADKPVIGSVSDFTIDTGEGALRLRHYAPAVPPAATATQRPPLLVFLHGGGFALGDLDTHDLPCRLLCRSANTHILSVDYRLAPEHPFPAGLQDAQAALRWASEHAAELGADPARIAIGGDSAGANMSAVLAQDCSRGRGPTVRAQLLIYPCTDFVARRPSRDLFGHGLILTRSDMDWFDSMYANGGDRNDPRLSPLRAADLKGLPPALLVTAGFDPLRDEGEAYADALRDAGNQVSSWRERGLLHGFINYAGVSRECRAAVKRIGARLGALLH